MRLKIKDRITLGIAAGLIGGIPSRFLNAWEYRKGYIDFRWPQLAASPFYPKGHKAAKGLPNWTGRIANQVLLGTTGIAVTYVLSATGRDQAMLKGAGISALEWLGLYGLSQKSELTSFKKPLSDLLSFLDHVTAGAIMAILVSTIGDNTLFPSADRQVPLVGQKAADAPALARS